MSGSINHARKPNVDLPLAYVAFTRTPTFNSCSLPAGLRELHSTARGVWGEIVVERGGLRYDWLDGSGDGWDLAEGEVGVIPAQVPHRVRPLSDDTRFYLRLYRDGAAVDRSADAGKPQEMDLRPLPPPLRHREIFAAFDALGPGEALLFVNDHDPQPLLGQFEVLRRHRYLWLPQAVCGDRWSVCLVRREERTAPTVGEALQADHVRLDALLDRAQSRLAEDRPASAAMADFIWGLRRHIRLEEQTLFPAFVQAGGAQPPTQVMALEHRRIEQYLDSLEGNPSYALTGIGELRGLLEAHNFKEEGVLYPKVDQVLEGRHAPLVEALFRERG